MNMIDVFYILLSVFAILCGLSYIQLSKELSAKQKARILRTKKKLNIQEK